MKNARNSTGLKSGSSPQVIFGLWVMFFLLFSFGCKPLREEGISGGVATAQWQTVSEPDLGFRIDFPGKPELRNQAFNTASGAGQVFLYSFKHIAFEYGLSVMRLPPAEVNTDDLEGVLDATVQDLVREKKGLLSFQESMNVGGFPGRRATVSLPETYLKDNRAHTLIVLRGNYVYRVTAAGIGNIDIVQHFFNSFEILPFPGEES